MKLIFLGPPGAGKGTQAVAVSAELGIPHISTGDILRANIRTGTELGTRAKEYVDKGQLVPDSLILNIIRDRLSAGDCENGFLLDGFPRTLAQAQSLGKITDIDAVINIDVDDQTIVERLSGRRVCPACGATYHVSTYADETCTCGERLIQRNDDKPETVLNRLSVYHEQTRPLIEYYRQSGKLHTVRGSAGIQALTREILNIIDKVKR